MDFKKLFENNKAVSPVIGVILMVAITVILAAAIGSSVFGKGTTESAPQANFDIKPAGIVSTTGSIKIEHLGGDSINFASSATKVMVSVDGSDSKRVLDTEVAANLSTLDVGDVKTLALKDGATNNISISTGQTVNIKFIDINTNQLICDKDVRF